MPKIQNELTFLWKAVANTKFGKLTKKNILKELLINGVALLITLLISSGIHSLMSGYIREKNNKDRFNEKIHYEDMRERVGFLKKLEKKDRDDRVALEKEEISNIESWVSGIVVFIIGLFVFTYVEAVLERFFRYREESVVG